MVQKYIFHPNFATFTLSEAFFLLIIHTLSLTCRQKLSQNKQKLFQNLQKVFQNLQKTE